MRFFFYTKKFATMRQIAIAMLNNQRKKECEKEGNIMTRAEVEAMLKSLGIENPAKETIDDFMNKHNAEVQREKAIADKYKADATKVSGLEAQLEELNNKNLSDIDIAKKDTEKANARVADLEKQIAIMQRKNALAEKGIIGEQADKLFNSDGALDIEVLGQIISDRETKAKSLLEKELLHKTPDPKGSDKNNETKTDIDKMAEAVGKEIANANKAADNVLSHYLK